MVLKDVLGNFADISFLIHVFGCVNSKLSEYLHYRVHKFKLRKFKTERKIV